MDLGTSSGVALRIMSTTLPGRRPARQQRPPHERLTLAEGLAVPPCPQALLEYTGQRPGAGPGPVQAEDPGHQVEPRGHVVGSKRLRSAGKRSKPGCPRAAWGRSRATRPRPRRRCGLREPRTFAEVQVPVEQPVAGSSTTSRTTAAHSRSSGACGKAAVRPRSGQHAGRAVGEGAYARRGDRDVSRASSRAMISTARRAAARPGRRPGRQPPAAAHRSRRPRRARAAVPRRRPPRPRAPPPRPRTRRSAAASLSAAGVPFLSRTTGRTSAVMPCRAGPVRRSRQRARKSARVPGQRGDERAPASPRLRLRPRERGGYLDHPASVTARAPGRRRSGDVWTEPTGRCRIEPMSSTVTSTAASPSGTRRTASPSPASPCRATRPPTCASSAAGTPGCGRRTT